MSLNLKAMSDLDELTVILKSKHLLFHVIRLMSSIDLWIFGKNHEITIAEKIDFLTFDPLNYDFL